MNRPTRLKRWLLPATGISVALGGIGFLAAGELAPGPTDAPWPLSPAPGSAPTARTGDEPPRAAPATAARVAQVPRTSCIRPALTQRRETAPVLHATGTLGELARARDLTARIAIVDRLARTLEPDEAAGAMEGLLDSALPGSFREAEDLRLLLLARLGDLRVARARRVLLARLDSEKPRPQRLIALEMLAADAPEALGDVEAIARFDHDSVVRAKARQVLARYQ